MKNTLRAPLVFIEVLLDIVASLIKKLFIAIVLAFLAALVIGTLAVFVITKIAS